MNNNEDIIQVVNEALYNNTSKSWNILQISQKMNVPMHWFLKEKRFGKPLYIFEAWNHPFRLNTLYGVNEKKFLISCWGDGKRALSLRYAVFVCR